MLGFLVLAWVAAMSIPAVLAFREKRRRELAGAPPFDETSDEIDLAAIFEELDARSTASAFRGGHLLVWYGGGRLDLRAATLDPNGASLDVRSLFGGLQIVVPPSWPVEVHPLVFAGGSATHATRAWPIRRSRPWSSTSWPPSGACRSSAGRPPRPRPTSRSRSGSSRPRSPAADRSASRQA
jgi:hypothetical protein